MIERQEVEALRARVLREADNAAGRGVRLADMLAPEKQVDTLRAAADAMRDQKPADVDGVPAAMRDHDQERKDGLPA